MAKRRKLRSFLGGAAQGAGDVLSAMAQNKMLMDRQLALRDVITDSQRELSAQNQLNEVMKLLIPLVQKGELDPNAAGQFLGGGMDFSPLAPPPARRAAPVVEQIGKAQQMRELPSEQDILGLLAGAGVNTTPVLQRKMNVPQEGELPSQNFMPSQPSAVQQVLNQRGAKQQAITLADQLAMDQKLAEAYGTKYQEGMATEDVAAQTFDASLKRQGQEAFHTAEQGQLGQTTPAVVRGKAKLAAAESGAREQARIDVLTSPQNVAREVLRQTELAKAEIAKSGMMERAKYIEERKQSAMEVAPILGKLEDLFEKAVRGNPLAARAYHQLREANAARWARFAGDNGRLSDQDLERAGYNLPNFSDILAGGGSLEVARDKFRTLKALIVVQPRLAAELADADPSTYFTRANELMAEVLEQQSQDAAQELTIVPDPATGGFKLTPKTK